MERNVGVASPFLLNTRLNIQLISKEDFCQPERLHAKLVNEGDFLLKMTTWILSVTAVSKSLSRDNAQYSESKICHKIICGLC